MKQGLYPRYWFRWIIGSLCFTVLTTTAQKAESTTSPERFAIIADAGRWNNHTQKIHDSIQRAQIHQLILPGDNLYDEQDTYESVWSHWRGFNFFAVALGNNHKSYLEEIQYFEMPHSFYVKLSDQHARFLILNSEDKSVVSEQMNWLTKQLSIPTQRQTWIVLHHPPYTLTKNHPWTERKKFQKAFRPLLHQYKDRISGILAGHDHFASLISLGSNIPLIVSGATQEPGIRPSVSYTYDDGYFVNTRWRNSEEQPHWVELEVLAGLSRVTFINAHTNQTLCRVEISPQVISPTFCPRWEN